LEQDIRELLDNLLEENLKEKLGRKMRELYLAEEKKDKEKSVEILKAINEINLKIQNIKNNSLKS
jgi:hypothetical protein